MWTYKNSKIRVNPETRKIWLDRIISPRQSGFLCVDEEGNEITAEMVFAEFDRQNPPELIEAENELQQRTEKRVASQNINANDKLLDALKLKPKIAEKPTPNLHIPNEAIKAMVQNNELNQVHINEPPNHSNLISVKNYAKVHKCEPTYIYRLIRTKKLFPTFIDGIPFFNKV